MGLKKNMTLPNGVNLKESYSRIREILFRNKIIEDVIDKKLKQEQEITIKVDTFFDKKTRNEGKPLIKSMSITTNSSLDSFNSFFDFDVLKGPGKNLMSQCYEFLKTKNDFKDAADE